MVSKRIKTNKPTSSHSGQISPAERSSRSRGRAPITLLNPKESEVMKALKPYLDRKFGDHGWIHVPNEMVFLKFLRGVLPKPVFEKIKYMLINFMKSIGVKKDFVDILIFRVASVKVYGTDIYKDKHGMALEVKREKGGRVSPGQREWLEYFDLIGWATAIGYGYQDTVNKIEAVYGEV